MILGHILAGALPLCAQYTTPGQIPMGDFNAMQVWLNQAGAAQKVDFLMRLGVDPVLGKNVVEELIPGQQIELHPVRSPGATQYGVVFLPGFRGCFLNLLEEKMDDAGKLNWRVIDQQTLDCWDGAATLELIPLRVAGWDDLVLHHVNVGHGSGYLKEQTLVFSVMNGRLVRVLET